MLLIAIDQGHGMALPIALLIYDNVYKNRATPPFAECYNSIMVASVMCIARIEEGFDSQAYNIVNPFV